MATCHQVTTAECFICAESLRKLHFFECRHRFCLKCLKKIDGDLGRRKKKPSRCPLCKHETLMKDVDVAEMWSGYKTTMEQADFHLGLEEKSLRCDKHYNQDRSIYCENCLTLECPRCISLDHSTHFTTELPVAFDQSIREIEGMVSAVKENINILTSGLKASSEFRKTLNSNFEDTKRKISSTADREVSRIRQREQQLLDEAGAVFKDRVDEYRADRGHKFTVIGQSKRKLNNVSKFMTLANRSAILHHKETFLNDLKELKERSQPKKSHDMLSFMDFEEVDSSLGKLVLEETTIEEPLIENPPRLVSTMKWKMKASITKYSHMSERGFNFAFDVAVFPDGEIVIADIENNHLVACPPPLQSESSQATPRSLDIRDSLRVAVNTNSELIVADINSVRVHSRDYRQLHKITPGKDTLLCLAVTDFNLIALGYVNEICLFTPKGSKIRAFPAPMIGQYLTTYKHCLIYTNPRESKLESFNLKGDRVFSVDLEVGGLPRGVCCDKDGSIFVAFGKGHISGKIAQYSPDGKYIGCIIEECGEPWSIKLTPNGDLVVAAGKSVKIYHRA